MKHLLCLVLLAQLPLLAQKEGESQSVPQNVSADRFSQEVTSFLGQEIAAHVADIHSLNPPQERVEGALTTGDFSWGAFMRAVASYSELSGQRVIAGKDVPGFLGQMGLIEARHGGKTFAQLYAAISLRSFGFDLNANPLWQSLTPEDQTAWRSLLDINRFYDPATRHVINLPENYFGVAARIVSMDYQLGVVRDKSFAEDVLNRAAGQFTSGALYSDDNMPTGRYDRYSNEYARYVYDAAENVGDEALMRALEPTLKTQMATWWDLLSPDGYGYPWGRSLGIISYIDTLEIVGFLGKHAQFRPAPLPQLAAAYHAAWQSIMRNYHREKHLLNVLDFGHGNYSYINPEREWQQTAAFFGKAAGAHKLFVEALRKEHVDAFPAQPQLPRVARFEQFRKAPRPAGVWLVRGEAIQFALPITTGTKPGISDYLPAPYDLSGFAPPVEQQLPTLTPYLELNDGSKIVAGDGADEIIPGSDGHSLKAVWRKWAVVGGKPGQMVDPGLATEVTWTFQGDTLTRSEKISATRPVSIRKLWVAVPSTASDVRTLLEQGRRVDVLLGSEGALRVVVEGSSFPFNISALATGDSPFGKGSRGAVPLVLNLEAADLSVAPGKDLTWSLSLRKLAIAGSSAGGHF